MVGENADLFPNMRKQVDAKQIVLNTETLSNGFKMLTFASKDDTLRPIMGTINLSSKDGTLAFAATSGYNLGIYEENIQLEEFNVNIPAKIAKIVSDLSIKNENVSIIFDETNIKFEVQDFIISYRLFEGRFPNYRSVITTENNISVVANCEDLISAINRVSVFADDASMMIRFELRDNGIVLTSESLTDQRGAKEKILLESNYSDFTIGFKANLLSEILKTIETENCKIYFKDSASAAVFMPEAGKNQTLVLMPMQINN